MQVNGTLKTVVQIITAFLIIAGLVANFAVSKYKIDENCKRIDRNTDELRMLREWYARVDERMKVIETNTTDIKSDIRKILEKRND